MTGDSPADESDPTVDDESPGFEADQARGTNAKGDAWPVELRGVTESVVTTLGPNDRWNAAALGLFAGDPVTATTWGNTRTRRNFRRRGEGYVQFTTDPVDFVDAALSVSELEEPILESADAWVRVAVESVETREEDGTVRETWALRPLESAVVRETVPTIDRGFGAVVEATVAASRLGVPEHDDERLADRLEYCADVVERTGGPREREAMDRVQEHSRWGGDSS